MKLIYAIVSKDDNSIVSEELNKSGFTITKLSSSGGFLKQGNTTFIIATEDEKVEKAIEIISKFCKKRKQISPLHIPQTYGSVMPYPSTTIEVSTGGATIFVTDIERFEKF